MFTMMDHTVKITFRKSKTAQHALKTADSNVKYM